VIEDWTLVVKQEVAYALGVDLSDVPDDATLDSTDGWDSLAQSIIIIRLEELIGQEIGDDDALGLVSLAALTEFVRRRSPKS
jgi:acyl carrier protein